MSASEGLRRNSAAPSIKLIAYSLTRQFGVIGARENVLGGTIRISKQFLYHLKRFRGTKSPEHIINGGPNVHVYFQSRAEFAQYYET